MDLTLLRKALNLGDDVSDDAVLSRASTFVQEQGKTAQDATGKLSSVTTQLATHGLVLDGEKVVKLARVELSTDVKDGDDPEKAQLRAALAKANAEQGTNQVATATKEVDAAIKGGKIPTALKAEFVKLASIGAEAPLLALATDGKLVQEKFSDALECVKKILGGLPKLTGDQLQQLATVKPEDQKGGTTGDTEDGKMDKKKLSAIAARNMPQAERVAMEARNK